MKDVQVALVIAIADVTAAMKVGGKDVRVFIDGAILHGCLLTLTDFGYLAKATIQKIDLKMKRPAGHVIIKIAQIRIMLYRFI